MITFADDPFTISSSYLNNNQDYICLNTNTVKSLYLDYPFLRWLMKF